MSERERLCVLGEVHLRSFLDGAVSHSLTHLPYPDPSLDAGHVVSGCHPLSFLQELHAGGYQRSFLSRPSPPTSDHNDVVNKRFDLHGPRRRLDGTLSLARR